MYTQQINIMNSENAESCFNRGVKLMGNGAYAEAEACFRRTLSLAPDSLETLLNLGYALDNQGRSGEAFSCYESVLAVDPGNAKARYNRATHLLRAGNLIAGFADYEARFAAIMNADCRVYTQPRWDGTPLNGRSVLVYCEQGLGDAIQFSRYIPNVIKMGGRVILEVQPPLVSLLSGFDCVERVMEKSEIPPFTDVHVPLLSLPHIFQTALDTIPDQTPYLMPSEELVSIWKERVKSDVGATRIGLAWAGKSHPYPNRSCPPENLEPLFSLPGFEFYSLQVGEERFPLSRAFSERIADLTSMIRDFSDTAALICNLDLVITIDTSVAHLAGALGKPVWVMLPHDTDWRWMLNRNDSPWYPTMRLFRQPEAGDWQSVVCEIIRSLQQHLLPRKSGLASSAELLESSFRQGLAFIDNSELDVAARVLSKLLAELPDDPAIWFNLGRAYDLAGKLPEAEYAYRQALSGEPGSPAIWFGLGGILLKQKGYQEAGFCLRKAHELNPESIEILLILGSVYVQLDNIQGAFDCCHKILAIKPDSFEAKYNLAFLQLRAGDYLSGFANFEARFGLKNPWADTRAYGQPRWDGCALNGRSILVYGEEGMGDVIQFSRYIPFLAEMGGSVVFEVDPPLLPLFAGFPGVTRIVPKSETPPLTDVYIQTLSLPYLFGTTLETVPNRIPYLLPDEAKVERWRKMLAEDTNYKIGLVWRGNPLNPRDSLRSCSLATFLPLAALPDITYYSLQVGAGSAEAASPPAGMRLADLSSELTDFTETAALIANLDLVIAVDTAVAHLAGAMGKPVWVLLPEDSDWRWLQGRSDTPWYPGMRLFSQGSQDGWAGALEQVRDALGIWLEQKSDIHRNLDVVAEYEKGIKFKEIGDLAGAESCFRRIVQQYPDLPDPQHSLGVVLQMQGRPGEAVEHYKAAIALDPRFDKAVYNLANAFAESGMFREAIDCAHELIRRDPSHADAHGLLGMLLLLHGDYSEGWKEYEWRCLAKQSLTRLPVLGRPLWDGSPLEGKTLLIQLEQGRGDMIQFVRFASMAAALGGRVVVSTLPELVSLLSTADGVSKAVDQNGILPDFDSYIPAMSLPRLMGTTLESIPSNVPYLHPDPLRVEEFSREMPADAFLRIGLAWKGSSEHKNDKNRSTSLAAFQPLFDFEGVVFYSLQIGEGSEQLKNLPVSMEVVDLADHIHDFADTAALIENLDLVICVDTAVAHLAGAINKPVWTLLHFVADWRWLLERSDSQWYPSMRLFRQEVPGDWAGVISSVRRELAQMLAQPEFHNQRGIALLLKGEPARAELVFFTAIAMDQGYLDAYCNRGVALNSLNRADEALDCYQAALLRQPDNQQILFNMGNTYMSLGRLEDARACYERVVELNPYFVAAQLCLGEVAKQLQNFALARAAFESALSIDPDCAEAFQGVAEIYQADERYEDSISAYRRVLELKPGSSGALNMMGTAYQSIEMLDEAEECYRQVLAVTPDKVAVLNNLGVVLNAQGRLEEAVMVYRRLFDIDPDYADGHWNLAVTLLAMGAYSEGWKEFEWRFKKANPVPSRPFSQPLWDGGELSGKTILLHAEQGFGDTFQFSRYIPLVAKRGGTVVIECQIPALKEVLLSLEGVSHVLAFGEPLPYFDCHLPLMSLPKVFGTTLETIPANIPYVAADPQKVATWRQRMGRSGCFKVGLVWYAKQSQVLNRKRSCPLSFFSPLWGVEGAEFYTLQIGVGTEQLEDFAASHQIIDLTSEISSFADTAAFIANLDLVITIDTAVAHLAGALGSRTWVVLPYVAEWRWLRQREDSPWYPTMRLFRQPSQGDWPSLMDHLAKTLRETLDSRSCKRVKTAHSRLRVGLAWRGRQDNPLNCKRSCPFSVLEQLFDLDGITFVKLQLDTTEDFDPRMIDMTDQIRDFEDTAALMANLDLIISIDTAVAHLAAATGRPTWVLLPHVADWRWSAGNKYSPWYPEAELFRQPDFGDWDGVIREVASRLSEWSGNLTQQRQITPIDLKSRISAERCELEQLLEIKRDEAQRDSVSPDAHLNLGAALALLGRDSEAAGVFRHVLELDPEHVAGHLNLAYSLMAISEYPEGLEHFEWRLKRLPPDLLPPWPMLHKNMLGTHPAGLTVMVHCEQGYGDTIQFCRFLPLLAGAGYKVVLSCQPAVASLAGSIPGVSRVIPHGDPLPLCDLQILLLSLPWLFSVDREFLPLSIPYIVPGEQKMRDWEEKLGNFRLP